MCNVSKEAVMAVGNVILAETRVLRPSAAATTVTVSPTGKEAVIVYWCIQSPDEPPLRTLHVGATHCTPGTPRCNLKVSKSLESNLHYAPTHMHVRAESFLGILHSARVSSTIPMNKLVWTVINSRIRSARRL